MKFALVVTRKIFGRPRSTTKASSALVNWKARKLAIGVSEGAFHAG